MCMITPLHFLLLDVNGKPTRRLPKLGYGSFPTRGTFLHCSVVLRQYTRTRHIGTQWSADFIHIHRMCAVVLSYCLVGSFTKDVRQGEMHSADVCTHPITVCSHGIVACDVFRIEEESEVRSDSLS